MILDQRTYTLHPGKLAEYLAAYEAEGYPIQTRHLGKPFGYFFTEVGTLNQIVHMWAYESMADREQKRAAMAADPAWQAWVKKGPGFFQHQENCILKSAPFFPGR
ncbi:MAG: NIPSNAP family protein [Alphaproteobacteria bacterium]|nr:NIPSNAP family protein [Alphaproteobacteria bacterium]